MNDKNLVDMGDLITISLNSVSAINLVRTKRSYEVRGTFSNASCLITLCNTYEIDEALECFKKYALRLK